MTLDSDHAAIKTPNKGHRAIFDVDPTLGPILPRGIVSWPTIGRTTHHCGVPKRRRHTGQCSQSQNAATPDSVH